MIVPLANPRGQTYTTGITETLCDSLIRISFRGIGKTFPGVNALTDISFDCYAGQVHALMGENGAGKSTLLKILSGNYTPTTGTLAIRGEEVAFADTTAALNAGVAIIYQELHLIPEMTVAENIYLGQLRTKAAW